MNSSTAQNLLVRNVILVLCVALPWLNPFASSPSTAVIPLLVSWMMAACALLAVVELPLAKSRWTASEAAVCGVLLAWLVASLLWVPQVVDRALTMGLVASLMCVWLMVAVLLDTTILAELSKVDHTRKLMLLRLQAVLVLVQ